MAFDKLLMFVCILTAIGAVSKVMVTWIKHRSPRRTGEDRREVQLLSNENAGLKSQMGRLEARIAVLERIATDPAERTAREIEQLRQA